jgi:uncharacterized protein
MPVLAQSAQSTGTHQTALADLVRYGLTTVQTVVCLQRAVGDTYSYGWGVPRDTAEAAKWYRLAAEQGDVRAQKRLAAIYSFGDGLPEDQAEAVKWYLLAAEQGDAGARHSLGLKYLRGQGVQRDYVLAYMWFSLAASADRHEGEPDYGAIWECRDLAARHMTPDQIVDAKRLAQEWKPTTGH